MSDAAEVVGDSFFARWVVMDKTPNGLKIVPTAHLKIKIGDATFYLTRDHADELAGLIDDGPDRADVPLAIHSLYGSMGV